MIIISCNSVIIIYGDKYKIYYSVHVIYISVISVQYYCAVTVYTAYRRITVLYTLPDFLMAFVNNLIHNVPE